MNTYQIKLEVEASKEILLQTILNNKENLETELISDAIKEYVKNHEKYNFEKQRILDDISKATI